MNAVLRRLSPIHPAFFKFINCIRLHEFSKSTELFEMLKWENGQSSRSRKRTKADRLDDKLKLLTKDLEDDPAMDAGTFLSQIACEPVLPDAGVFLLNRSIIINDPATMLCQKTYTILYYYFKK